MFDSRQSHLVHFIVVLQSQHPGTDGLTGIGNSPHFIWIKVRVLRVFLQFVENLCNPNTVYWNERQKV